LDQQWQDFVAFSRHHDLVALVQQRDKSFSQRETVLDQPDSVTQDLLERLPFSPSLPAPCVSEPPSEPERVEPGPVAVVAAAIPGVSTIPASAILEYAAAVE
jgi:hypothetical protein